MSGIRNDSREAGNIARWSQGYVSDVPYTTSFSRESTPIWLAFACLFQGFRPPDLSRPFRYADLGCGNGLTTIIVAACSPQAQVWGFDFNPAHIESARRLAGHAGLTNVRFVETSFTDLAALPAAALPAFDFMVSHGVLSWISPENRAHLTQVIGQRLSPGGLAYLSYNAAVGWAGVEAIGVLMRTLADLDGDRSDLAIPRILDFIDRLEAAGARYFDLQPVLKARLTNARRQDARYVAHEFLNDHCHPFCFPDTARAMADAKCAYIGSATLTDNMDSISIPPGILPILTETSDPLLRETLRDLASAHAFRRDVYRKGAAPMPVSERQARLSGLEFVWTGKSVDGRMTVPASAGPVMGSPKIFGPVIRALQGGRISLSDVNRLAFALGGKPQEALTIITMLVAGGVAHPALPGTVTAPSRDAGRRINQAIGALNAAGDDVPCLAAPTIGSAIETNSLETLVVSSLLDGGSNDPEALSCDVLERLTRNGRAILWHNSADSDRSVSVVGDAVKDILARMGALEALGLF